MNEWELTDEESYHAEGEGFNEWVGHGEPPHMKDTMERRAIARAAQKKLVEWMAQRDRAKDYNYETGQVTRHTFALAVLTLGDLKLGHEDWQALKESVK